MVLEVNQGEYTSPVLTTKDLTNLGTAKAKPKAVKVPAAPKTPDAVPVVVHATKVDEFKDRILDLQAQGINPVTFGNKSVTAARRVEWRQALTELGIAF